MIYFNLFRLIKKKNMWFKKITADTITIMSQKILFVSIFFFKFKKCIYIIENL